MPGFPSKLNDTDIDNAFSSYLKGQLTQAEVAANLGVSLSYVQRLQTQRGIRKLDPTRTGVGVASRAASKARSDIRDQAVIDVVYSGMTQTDAAKKYGVSRLAMNRWIAAYNAELRNPTPEDQRPRETDKRNLKSWAFFAVCRIEARMREEA